MGKSKQEQDEKYFDDAEELEILNNEQEISMTEHIKTIDEEKIKNASVLLRKRMIEYSKENYLPLCEYLDISNVHNFVTWIMLNQ